MGGRVKLANDVTYKRCVYFLSEIGKGKERDRSLCGIDRMNWTMERLKKMEEREYTTLTRMLFGFETPTPVAQDEAKLEFFDQTLNDSQRDAVRFALASREVAIIHGPPGVGRHDPTTVSPKLMGLRRAKPTPSSNLSCNWSNANCVSWYAAHLTSQLTTSLSV